MEFHDEIVYKDTFTAFIDILGFSSIVEKSKNNKEYLELLNKLIISQINFMRFERFSKIFESTFFSDSFILTPKHPNKDVIYIIRHVAHLCRQLMNQGLICRGSIVKGQIYHMGKIVLGPALVDAYNLEQKTAFYPRIILDNQCSQLWEQEIRPYDDGKMYDENIRSWIKIGTDGLYQLNIFAKDFSNSDQQWDLAGTDIAPIKDHAAFLEKTEKMIQEHIKYCTDPHIIQKYKWLLDDLLSEK